jgi:para-aminobenzoate synthetase component 1
LLAVGVKNSFTSSKEEALVKLQEFINEKPRWLFGHLGYDLKTEPGNISSTPADRIFFPDTFFFETEIIIRLTEKEMVIETGDDAEEIFSEISNCRTENEERADNTINLQQKVSKEEYIQKISKLKEHILRGDCYEINYCMEFFAEQVTINPLLVYQKLSAASPNPFSALYKLEDKFLICASPERYLKKTGNQILSQPIKGTSSRFIADNKKDLESRDELYKSEKDRSENVMVVDLVRNDLSKVCREGTVKVDELFGIYSFPQVHQMISTVSGELKEGISFSDIIKATFPMGSMTGAPKKRVMELIGKYEKSRRGIFSGALGYITPGGDFDFNVVIRSIMYNASEKYLSFMAGSGITFYSHEEKEYEECLLKAEAMKLALM